MREAVFADIFAHAPLAIALIEPAPPFRIAEANAAFLELVGRRREGARGVPLLEVVPRAAPSGLATMVESVLRERGSETILDSWNLRPGVQAHWEITIAYPREAQADGLALVTIRDVSEREESRRKLERECVRLLALMNVGSQMVALEPKAVLEGATTAASLLCDGPAVIYLVEPGGELRRAASHRVMPEIWPLLPVRLGRRHLPLVRKAIETRERQTTPYLATLPGDQRALLSRAQATWLVVNPVRARGAALGALVTLWRRRQAGPIEDLKALDVIAAQSAVALENAHLHAASESERARLDLILEEIPDDVWIVDAEARLVRTNSAGRRTLGLGADDPLPDLSELGRRLEEFDGNEGGGGAGDLGLRAALRGRPVTGALYTLRRGADDTERWLLASAAPLRDHDRRVIGAVGVSTDITERRRAEEMLRLLAAASVTLAASLDHRATLTAMAQVTVPGLGDWCLVDLLEEDGTVLRLPAAHVDPSDTEAAADLARLAPDPSTFAAALAAFPEPAICDVGEAPLVSMLPEPERRGMLRALHLRACMAVPVVVRGRKVGLLQLATSWSGRRYRAADLAVAEDLAYRAAMAIDNARLYQTAREADRRKDEFLAVLSHELRTPLAPLLTWVEVLRRAPDTAHVRHAAEVIERNVRVQRALVNELLDLAAITRDKVALETQSIDLVELVRACTDTLRGEAERKSIRLAVELSEHHLTVKGDPNRLHQVFANLVSNAIKFTPSGGLVRVTLEREGGAAVARVRDTGEGISPAFLPHVFEIFKQQEEGTRREHGGLGIGLALAKRLTELHQGTIAATSQGPGRGTEFIVRLPLQDRIDDAETVAEPAPVAASEEQDRPLRDLSVLLVEDADDMREAMRTMLEELGARVVDAGNGEEALARLRPEETDVVLCDLRMPLMDGYEFVSLLRKDPERAHVPVVAVSGFASQESYSRTQDAGFDAYVTKPFEYATLVATLQQAMAARQHAEATRQHA